MALDPTSNSKPERQATYAAPALEKGFTIMELLADFPGGLTISEIAVKLDLSISEIFRIMMVMERREWLRKSAGDKFSVTMKVLDLAFKATRVQELMQAAEPHMRQLASTIGQSCHLVVRDGAEGLVVYRQLAPGPTALGVAIGARIALETTCSGHVLLAFDAVDGGALYSAATPSRAIQSIIERVQSHGYEVMKSARTVGVTDISCPILNRHGRGLAALTVPYLQLIDGTQSVNRKMAREHLQAAAAQISQAVSRAL